MSYSKKLKDPRWQKARLKILERDDFTCQLCFNAENTLHVHHLSYHGKNPWDTPTGHLITLCEDCHNDIHSGFTHACVVRVCSKLMKDNDMNSLEELDVFVNGYCMGKRALLKES